ncbi:MAG: DUF2167 domain-containing protein [Alphaproteobacteria bacterium]|nr:DUF2167 domain-containing protein [Alphaproteobacteria bacterium]MCB9798008.1 DUF2167 domain-containing protein [Alphaproteobacteria bacterium]
MFTALLAALSLGAPAFAEEASDLSIELPEEEAPQEEALEEEEALPTLEELTQLIVADGVPEGEAQQMAVRILERLEFERSLEFQAGEIELKKGLATLSLPEDYLYLKGKDADRVLQAWGNPAGGGGLGMIVPADVSLFSEAGWAVLITYEEDGYVEDDDAEDMDWDELLESMQEGTEEGNEVRRDAGLVPLHLEDWAEPPHYDGGRKLLYWATVLRDDEANRSLNYDIRVLGRRGVLAMSAIAGVEQLAELKPEMERVLTFATFNEGHRYEDFDPDIDEVAAYGIGALVAGKLASKAGLFALMGAFLLKAKKLVIVAVLALGAGFKNLFGGSKTPED